VLYTQYLNWELNMPLTIDYCIKYIAMQSLVTFPFAAVDALDKQPPWTSVNKDHCQDLIKWVDAEIVNYFTEVSLPLASSPTSQNLSA
jgi:hypothetical protein